MVTRSSLSQSFIQAIIWTTWIAHKLYFPEPVDSRITHIIDQLNIFASRDQLSIELLPPGVPCLGNLLRALNLSTGPLQVSSILGEALQLGGVQFLLFSLDTGKFELYIWAANGLVAASALFTTDLASLLGVWIACGVVRIALMFREIAATKKPLITCILIVVSLCLGSSEVAYGGNYNLRYLDAESRRSMRPGFDMPRGFSDPGPGLHSMTPYSLYIPTAGFLWSDDMTWDADSGAFEPVERDSNTGRRAVMKDPVGRFAPWILQKDLGHSLNNGLEQEVLLEREPVVLRSVQSGHFIKVLPEPSLLEAHGGASNASETGRFAVSSSPTYSDGLAFDIREIGNEGDFRLYHPARGCFLATTFRSFPDLVGLRANDTVLRGLRSELEISCVQHAHERASTLHVIEGYHPQHTSSASWLSSSLSDHVVVRQLRKGLAIMASIKRLRTFRSTYPALQDAPAELVAKHSAHAHGQASH
ncbi:hypothetical protein LTR27_009548 [Elasticomyces elasticus]|nr:hypothetical protein LTR27_009548 [Elasticomyces elasticus]